MTADVETVVVGAGVVGLAVARSLAAAGHEVVIHYGTSRDEAEALARELGGTAVAGDLAETNKLSDLFARAGGGRPIDGLVKSPAAARAN